MLSFFGLSAKIVNIETFATALDTIGRMRRDIALSNAPTTFSTMINDWQQPHPRP